MDETPEFTFALLLMFIFFYCLLTFMLWQLGMFNHCPPDALPNDICNWIV